MDINLLSGMRDVLQEAFSDSQDETSDRMEFPGAREGEDIPFGDPFEEFSDFFGEDLGRESSYAGLEHLRLEECREAATSVVTPEVCDAWIDMPLEQRKEVMVELAAAINAAQGTDFKGVLFDAGLDDDDFGKTTLGFTMGDGFIHLNERVLEDSSQFLTMVDTVAHESRHQFQLQAIEDPERFGVSHETVEAWKYGFDTYTQSWASEYDLVGYNYNPTESDARIFGESIARDVGQNWKRNEMTA